jgi:hypothetical protein
VASPFEKGGTALGHWKAECPQRKDQAREQANGAPVEGEHHDEFPQVIVEELDEEPREGFMEMCSVVIARMHPSSIRFCPCQTDRKPSSFGLVVCPSSGKSTIKGVKVKG